MPVVSNPAYNDQTLGQGFSNLAQMFAPPSGSDIAGYANAAAIRQKMGLFDRSMANPNDPNFDRYQILLGNENGTNTIAAQNQNNATTQRGQDLNLKANEETALVAPLSAGQVRNVPTDLAKLYDVPPQQSGNIAAQPNETIVTPSGQTVKGAYMPSQDQLNASIESAALANHQLSPEQIQALIMGNTPVEAVAGPDGAAVNTYRPASVGKQPVAVTGGVAQAYDTKMGSDLATDYAALQTTAASAQNTLGTVAKMQQLINDPAFYSGVGADQLMMAKQALAAFGIDASGAASMEQVKALSNRMIVDGLNGSLGTGVSNADRQFIGQTKPNLSNSKAGNQQLLTTMQKLAQRQIDVAGLARQYAQQHGGRLDAQWPSQLQTWADQHPLFPEASQGAATGQTSAPGGYPEGTVISNGQQQYTMQGGKWVPST